MLHGGGSPGPVVGSHLMVNTMLPLLSSGPVSLSLY